MPNNVITIALPKFSEHKAGGGGWVYIPKKFWDEYHLSKTTRAHCVQIFLKEEDSQ